MAALYTGVITASCTPLFAASPAWLKGAARFNFAPLCALRAALAGQDRATSDAIAANLFYNPNTTALQNATALTQLLQSNTSVRPERPAFHLA